MRGEEVTPRLCVINAKGGTGKTTVAINASAGRSIFAYDEQVDVSDVFLSIATEIDRQFGYAEVTA
ncbi:MAG: hypothetical protein ABEH56_03470 [Salinirussus sp.]